MIARRQVVKERVSVKKAANTREQQESMGSSGKALENNLS